jgi:hypothetical protein
MTSRVPLFSLLLTALVLLECPALAQHPLDQVFERADRATNQSKNTIGIGAYRDLEQSSNDARDKASSLDDQHQSLKRSASVSSSVESNTTSTSSTSSPPVTTRTWICQVFCKSSTGPVVTHTVQAKNRSEAAKYMDRVANQVCRDHGLSFASGLSFPEKQCSEK